MYCWWFVEDVEWRVRESKWCVEVFGGGVECGVRFEVWVLWE